MFLNLAKNHPASAPTAQIMQLQMINLSRRHILGGMGGLTIGLTFAACSPKETKTAETTPAEMPDNSLAEAGPALLIAIAADGRVQIRSPRSEMGQQALTSVAQMIADELDVEWDRIELAQAIGHPKYGDQNTDGSTTVRNNMARFQLAGASMRQMLVQAAANEWGAQPSECTSELGVITHNSGKTLTYGDVAEAAGKLEVPAEDDVVLKDRKDWRYIGKSMPSLTVPKLIHGQGTFGIDVRVPDMLYAVIARPPTVFGKVKSFDDSEALAVPGVRKVWQLPDPQGDAPGFQHLGGVAVIATDSWAAMQGREALDIEWEAGPNGTYNSESYGAQMMATAQSSGEVKLKRGDVSDGLSNAATTVSADYYAAHLSQSPMEPPAATARWDGDQVECWACSQAPQAARSTVANVCGVPEDNVTINVTWLGGGFGRKSKPDFVVEAALIAREMDAPVKVTWTREDDLRHGYFHAVSAQHLKGGLDADGKPVAWLHRTVFPSINSTFAAGTDQGSDFELSLGATDPPYDIGNMQVEVGKANAHIRIGWLRSVANVYHHFAAGSFIAEMAHAAGRDPKDFLIEAIGTPRVWDPNDDGVPYPNYARSLEDYPIETGRLSAVIEKAASMAGWGRDLPAGHGLGISGHRSFLSYVATCVEVKVDDDGRISIPGVWLALDAGTVVNPAHTRAQMEGGTLFGLSNALYGQITATNGAVDQGNFPDWRVMRMREAPRTMDVHIMESDALPGGVGEPGTPPAAPALANAIFAATGKRLRRLPILGMNDRLDLTGEG